MNSRAGMAHRPSDFDIVKRLLVEYDELMVHGIDRASFAGQALLSAATKGELNIVQWLLTEKWVNVSFAGDGGRASLSCAAFCRRFETVQWLVENAGADVDQVDDNRWTALLHAARWGSRDIVQFLIKAGSNIEHEDVNGKTALLHAAYGSQYDMVYWLLTEGGCSISNALWLQLRPEQSCEIPSFLMHFMLLQRPPPKVVMHDIIRHASDKKSVKRMFVDADRLRIRKTEWLIDKEAILKDLVMRNLPKCLVPLLLDYSAPSTEEIWSATLWGPRRNPVRSTRKRVHEKMC